MTLGALVCFDILWCDFADIVEPFQDIGMFYGRFRLRFCLKRGLGIE